MGIVRREEKWRLEKQNEGVYEVTYENHPELKILTSDYEPSGLMDERNDFSMQVREVDSFSDAEKLFEEMAQSSPSVDEFGAATPTASVANSNSNIELREAEDSLSDLPPGGLFVVGAIVSALTISQAGLNVSSPVFLVGVAFLLLPLGIAGLTYRVYSTKGGKEAIKFLVSADNEDSEKSSRKSSDETTEKTPPAPQKMKDEIYFERANQLCEWCSDRTDSPEVHHIVARSENGPNEYSNLIALCPTCHSKADKGGISTTKLREKVSRQMEQWNKED